MMNIAKATISFGDVLPTVKVDGQEKQFSEITVNGKTFQGIKLDDSTYAMAKNVGGNFNVKIFKTDDTSLGGMSVKVQGGAVSKLKGTNQQKFVRHDGPVLRNETVTFNDAFARHFTNGVQPLPPKERRNQGNESLLRTERWRESVEDDDLLDRERHVIDIRTNHPSKISNIDNDYDLYFEEDSVPIPTKTSPKEDEESHDLGNLDLDELLREIDSPTSNTDVDPTLGNHSHKEQLPHTSDELELMLEELSKLEDITVDQSHLTEDVGDKSGQILAKSKEIQGVLKTAIKLIEGASVDPVQSLNNTTYGVTEESRSTVFSDLIGDVLKESISSMESGRLGSAPLALALGSLAPVDRYHLVEYIQIHCKEHGAILDLASQTEPMNDSAFELQIEQATLRVKQTLDQIV